MRGRHPGDGQHGRLRHAPPLWRPRGYPADAALAVAIVAAVLAIAVVSGCGPSEPSRQGAGSPAASDATASGAATGVAPGTPPATSGALSPSMEADRIAARITIEGMRPHLVALDRIARENGGTRATGSTGDRATAAYVASILEDAGLAVTEQRFDVPIYLDPGGNELVVRGPGGRVFEDGRDFRALIYSAAGTVEAPVAAVGWDPAATAPGGPSCTAADFAGIPSGAIVLVGPGDCWRRDTVLAAQAAGAAALVVASPWSGPGEVRRVTLLQPEDIRIPAVAASREVGEVLAAAAADGRTVRLVITGQVETREVRTVLAEVSGSDPDRVVMVGAHLDSSMEGPGMVDDGTGVAALLELARASAGERPVATIRFAFWAAEEIGLRGSIHYVQGLSDADRQRILAYLNADMLGSPNGIRGVYDEEDAAPWSDEITAAFVADLDAHGLAWEPVDLGGGADHGPFARVGVATGGLFSGATGVLTPAQVERYGGQAGRPLDPCYHLACDDLANVDETRLEELAGSFARVAVGLAFDAGS
ncbi:MAG: M20/M25/M40 family metallo-hydrolase [Chloroflexi bacterium]|nr:M20/M25/M40 family metallo-hydrolase [Chloroflexota bacterium]